MSEYKYKDGDMVFYKTDAKNKGFGVVRGVATTGAPVIGVGYIIEDEDRFPNEEYPYSFFVVFENMLKPWPVEE